MKRPKGTTKPWHAFPGPDHAARSVNSALDLIRDYVHPGRLRRKILKGGIYGAPQRERV